jgi:hypothetical protein
MTGHTGTTTGRRGPRITGAACLAVATAAAVAIPALLGRPVLGERPGVACVVLGVPLLVAAWAAGSQWRTGARTATATRALGWALFAVACLTAIPMALASYFFQFLFAAPDGCTPIPVPGGADPALGSLPVAVAGCVMALDLAHLCAVLSGTG